MPSPRGLANGLEALPKERVLAQLDPSSSQERYENALAHLTWRTKLIKGRRDSGEKTVYLPLKPQEYLRLYKEHADIMHSCQCFSYYSPRFTLAIGPATFSNPLYGFVYHQAFFALLQMSGGVPWEVERRVEGRLRALFATDVDFEGKYAGSVAVPTLQLNYQGALGPFTPRLILFIGHSELYSTLLRQAKLWLLGKPSVAVFILVYLVESPAYACPTSGVLPNYFAAPGFSARVQQANDMGHFKMKYKEMRSVGDFSGSFTETWVRDPINSGIMCSGHWPMYREDCTAQALSLSVPLYKLLPELRDVTPEADKDRAFKLSLDFNMRLMEGGDGGSLRSLACARSKRIGTSAGRKR